MQQQSEGFVETVTHINPWFSGRRRCAPGQATVLLFAHAGAGASVFHRWMAEFEDAEPVLVQLPGRETRASEPLVIDLRLAMHCAIARCIADLGDEPLICFDHSLGALLAFEVAQECLRSNCNAPKHLVLSDASPPAGRATSEVFVGVDARLSFLGAT